MNRACTAKCLTTSEFRSGEFELVAQDPQQRHVGIDIDAQLPAIDGEIIGHHSPPIHCLKKVIRKRGPRSYSFKRRDSNNFIFIEERRLRDLATDSADAGARDFRIFHARDVKQRITAVDDGQIGASDDDAVVASNHWPGLVAEWI